MKILFLSEFFPTEYDGVITGGSEGRTYYLAKELVKMGHRVSVLTSLMPQSRPTDDWYGLKVYRVGPERGYTQGGSLLLRGLYFINMIRKGLKINFDVVDGNNLACYFLAVILAKLKGKKSTYWVPDVVGVKDWIKALGWSSGLLATLVELVSIHIPVDHIIALSNTTANKLKRLWVNPAKFTVVYPPVLTTRKTSKRILRKLERPVILAVNRLVEYKRTDLPIRVLQTLPPKDRFYFHVVGMGTEKLKLETMVKKNRLEKWVRFLGGISREELLNEMENADIFSLSSEIEGFGIVTMEAMGFGTPFINSDIPVHREIEQAGHGGLLFKTGKVSDFKKKYLQLKTNPALYNNLSRSGYSFARNHSRRFAAKGAETVYQKLLSNG